MPTKPAKKKPAAKKPAAVDYKKKYETLVKAAKDVAEEYDEGQIECGCTNGRTAMAGLMAAAGVAMKFENGQIRIYLDSIPVMLTHNSEIEATLKIDGIEIPAKCIRAECYEESD